MLQKNVFKVCDEPHPVLVSTMISKCLAGDLVSAHWSMMGLCNNGYATSDVISTVFRVVRGYTMEEFLKLEFMREVGYCQMRISEGVNSRLQLSGMLAKLCKLAARTQQRR
jgi:replication factor C subunit 2/4